MRNYKKVSECPPKFQKVIDRLNLLPPGLDGFLEKLAEMQKQEVNEDKTSIFYFEYVKNLDSSLQEYILDREGNIWFYGEMVLRELYRDFQTLFFLNLHSRQEKAKKQRQGARTLKIKFKPKTPSEVASYERLEKASFNFGMININNELYHSYTLIDQSIVHLAFPQINENGIVELRLSDLAKSFQEEKIIVDRIRFCPFCKNIFWAKKINSKTCGEQVCIDGLQNYKKKYKTKKEEKTNNSFEISDQRKEERESFKNQNFSKKEGK